uniref:Photosynthetic NDH subcomplex L 2 n=1 Tax=Geranium phaeum TaxID=379952 RepID=A0A0F7CYJ5_9ROSI
MTISVATTATLLHIHAAKTRTRTRAAPIVQASTTDRRKLLVTTFLGTLSLGLATHPQASLAEKWGTRSFILERYFEPGLSPEDAVARIRQTAEGLHELRDMVDKMAWRYIIFYIRVKQAYLGQDLKNALSTLPEGSRQEFVERANDLVSNMQKLDDFVRSPKVYESYLYYEKTLKSIDKVVELL